ncbi:hypothetical protein AVEN_142178-1 [Araneus ventricosus]|uniref:Uncharacterized protein n=1 Tax=Araneus ventricosus TaxID=182803 RepID=A0A4Y2MT44_ARAVE|nr:hypothetical protein AVEN_142178-1 [Araneus ventricosus]
MRENVKFVVECKSCQRKHYFQNSFEALQNLQKAIKSKRPGNLSRGVVLLQDNEMLHLAKATKVCKKSVLSARHGWIAVLLFESIAFRLLLSGPLKKALKDKLFTCNQAVRYAVEEWFHY